MQIMRFMRPVGFGLLLLVGLPAGVAATHEIQREAHTLPPARVEVRSEDGMVTIPFRLVNNHVVIPASINGTRLDLVLDTGMPMEGVMLYKNDKVRGLGLEPAAGMKAQVAGAGGDGAPVMAEIAEGLTIDLDALRLTDARAIVAPQIPAFTSYHDGVIGASLFRNFVVAIDFDAGRITLHDPKTWTAPEKAASVPIRIEHNAPYAAITVLTLDGRRLPAEVVVDLGASHPISLNLGTLKGLEAPAATISTIVGRGLGGYVRGQVGRIGGIEVGGLLVKEILATFPIKEHQDPGGKRMGHGNLGNGFLQRFNVAFDYAHERMLLTPNKGFDRPFEWDMSGIYFQPENDATLRIADVVRNSAAAKAGLAVGDVVTRVNGRPVSAGDLPDVRQQLRQDGETVTITATRNGKPIDATLKLKRMV
ncbi:MAG TPA: PDZ domain-containing protein [Candidatus Polarisedimenticolia bacterium]|nr:PDZ domain-containing protein [Candidatus Polarisedimenticolia bacterium]